MHRHNNTTAFPDESLQVKPKVKAGKNTVWLFATNPLSMGTIMGTRFVSKKICNSRTNRLDRLHRSDSHAREQCVIFEGIRTIAQKIIIMYDRARTRGTFCFFGLYVCILAVMVHYCYNYYFRKVIVMDDVSTKTKMLYVETNQLKNYKPFSCDTFRNN